MVNFILSLEKFDNVCKDLELNFKEAERMLKQMDLEITTNSDLDKKQTQISFNTYKKKFETYKTNYFKIKETFTYTKKMEEMINSSREEESSNIELMNKQSLSLEKAATNSIEKLHNAKRTALVLENTSKNVMFDLENQTQTLTSTQLKLGELNSNIDSSNFLLNKMLTRENRNRAVLGALSVTLITFFLFILSSRI